jgi:hypothetical protein
VANRQEPCESTEDRGSGTRRAARCESAQRPTNQGHQRMPTPNATRLVLPASTLNMIVVSGSDATRTHAPIHTGRLPQFNHTQRHSQVRGRTADQRSHRRGHWFDPSTAYPGQSTDQRSCDQPPQRAWPAQYLSRPRVIVGISESPDQRMQPRDPSRHLQATDNTADSTKPPTSRCCATASPVRTPQT